VVGRVRAGGGSGLVWEATMIGLKRENGGWRDSGATKFRFTHAELLAIKRIPDDAPGDWVLGASTVEVLASLERSTETHAAVEPGKAERP